MLFWFSYFSSWRGECRIKASMDRSVRLDWIVLHLLVYLCIVRAWYIDICEHIFFALSECKIVVDVCTFKLLCSCSSSWNKGTCFQAVTWHCIRFGLWYNMHILCQYRRVTIWFFVVLILCHCANCQPSVILSMTSYLLIYIGVVINNLNHAFLVDSW
jgi:hypothetical protein